MQFLPPPLQCAYTYKYEVLGFMLRTLDNWSGQSKLFGELGNLEQENDKGSSFQDRTPGKEGEVPRGDGLSGRTAVEGFWSWSCSDQSPCQRLAQGWNGA